MQAMIRAGSGIGCAVQDNKIGWRFIDRVNYYTNSQIIVIPPMRVVARSDVGRSGGSAKAGFSSGYYPAPATSAAAYLEKFLDGLVPGCTLTFTFGAKGLGWRPDVFFLFHSRTPCDRWRVDHSRQWYSDYSDLDRRWLPTLAPLPHRCLPATGGDINVPGQAATGTYGPPAGQVIRGSPGVTLY
jgi:hypothetical protein